MKIISNLGDKLDSFVDETAERAPEMLSATLERMDAKLFCELSRETWSGGRRFVSVRRSERTVLSTIGPLVFRRRYYYDRAAGRYVCPLDLMIGLCRYSRMTDELRIKVLEMACECPYSFAGAHSGRGFALSKSTVARLVADCSVSAEPRALGEVGGKVHVQIDEKYISMAGKEHKSRYVTATIFAGVDRSGKRPRLMKRTVVSGVELRTVAAKINEALAKSYGVTAASSVWLSGDMAEYIRRFPERIACQSTYVPDRWHIARFLSRKGRPVKAADVVKTLESIDESGDLSGLGEDAAKVYRMWKEDPSVFDAWGDGSYECCCQEAMNSHYYAPRFGKYANRFKPSTVEKLSLMREARLNGWQARIASKSLREEGPSLLATLGRSYGDAVKYDIDTRQMDYASRKMFSLIEYGGL